jgi:hypothetical protein
VLASVKAPYVKEPLTEETVLRMTTLARSHFEADLADEAARLAEAWFRSAVARGEQMSANDCGKALLKAVGPVLDMRRERALAREREKIERILAARSQALKDELARLEQEASSPKRTVGRLALNASS